MNIVRCLLSAAAVAASTSLSAPAMAAPLTANELLNQFNLITFEDAETNHDVEGRAYVGGNLTGGSATFNIKGATPPPEYDALVVVGDVSGGWKHVNNGGDAAIGGNVGDTNMNGGTLRAGGEKLGTVNGAQHLFEINSHPERDPGFASRFPQNVASILTSASTMTAALGGSTPTTILEGKRFQLDAYKGPLEVKFSDISGANIEFEFHNVSAAAPLIINVTGGHGYLGAGFVGDGLELAAPFVLWNFVDATSIDFQKIWYGTILAPNAHVTNLTPIEGTLVAKSANLGGEMHLRPFDGDIPVVPVPATLPLIASALAGLALLRHRRRSLA